MIILYALLAWVFGVLVIKKYDSISRSHPQDKQKSDHGGSDKRNKAVNTHED